MSLCHALDSGDLGEASRLLYSGSKLALDLLIDGVASNTPAFRRQLARRALSILALGPGAVRDRLASQVDCDTFDIYRQEIISRLGNIPTLPAGATWKLLSLIETYDKDAIEAIQTEYLPSDPKAALELAAQGNLAGLSSRLRRVLVKAQLVAGPTAAEKFVDRLLGLHNPRYNNNRSQRYITKSIKEEIRICALPSAYINNPALNRFEGEGVSVMTCDNMPTLSVDIILIKSNRSALYFAKSITKYPKWAFVHAVSEFVKDPCLGTLKVFISTLETKKGLAFRGAIPWVLSSVASDHAQGSSVADLLSEAEQGELGGFEAWVAAEHRWKKRGLEPSDFLSWNSGRYITSDIAQVGAPCLLRVSRHSQKTPDESQVRDLLGAAKDIQSEEKRAQLLDAITFGAGAQSVSFQNYAAIKSMVDHFWDREPHRMSSLIAVLAREGARDEWILGWLDRCGGSSPFPYWRNIPRSFLANSFNENTNLRGLLPIFVFQEGVDHEKLISDARQLDSSAFDEMQSDSPLVKIAVVLLDLIRNKWARSTIRRYVDALISAEFPRYDQSLQAILKTVLSQSNPDRGLLLEALTEKAVEFRHRYHSFLLDLLGAEQDSKRTSLTEELGRTRLELPAMP